MNKSLATPECGSPMTEPNQRCTNKKMGGKDEEEKHFGP